MLSGLDTIELAAPSLPVERQAAALHLVEERSSREFDLGDLLESGRGDLGPNRIAHPEGLDRVSRGIGDLVFGEIVGGGVGQLHRALALGLEPEIVLDGPGQPVKPGDPTLALIQQGVGELGVPPSNVSSGVGRFEHRQIDDSSVEVRIPGIGGDATEHRSEERGGDISGIDDEGVFGAVGAPDGERHHAHLARHRTIDRCLGVDGDTFGPVEPAGDIDKLRWLAHEGAGNIARVTFHLSDLTTG